MTRAKKEARKNPDAVDKWVSINPETYALISRFAKSNGLSEATALRLALRAALDGAIRPRFELCKLQMATGNIQPDFKVKPLIHFMDDRQFVEKIELHRQEYCLPTFAAAVNQLVLWAFNPNEGFQEKRRAYMAAPTANIRNTPA